MELILGDIKLHPNIAQSDTKQYRALSVYKNDKCLGALIETEYGIAFHQEHDVITLLPTLVLLQYIMSNFDAAYEAAVQEADKEEA